MKGNIKYPLIILVMMALAWIIPDEGWSQASDPGEIAVITDRSLYISGETIFISAVAAGPDAGTSRILYCELVTPSGIKTAGAKLNMEEGRAAGCLRIPQETISGTYYLKAYTRVMRNYGPSGYFYSRIVIIHPGNTETLPFNPADTKAVDSLPLSNPTSDGPFSISSSKLRVKSRDTVTLSINGPENIADKYRLVSLAVVPLGSLAPYRTELPANTGESRGGYYITETRGLSLSGKVTDRASGKEIPGSRVNLSIIGQKDIRVQKSDSTGRFYFSLPPLTGNHDLFICTETFDEYQPMVLIDNDFCPERASLPSPELRLSDSLKDCATSMARNYLVSREFQPEKSAIHSEETVPPLSFYGKPTEVLFMDKYIDLPSLSEYFTELPLEIKLRRSQGKRYFRFTSTQAEMVIYDPLVLVDWVAIDNIDQVLGISPRSIERIELVNAPYVKGDMIYGGIISLVSRKADFAGIDLPSSGAFIQYEFLSECTDEGPEAPPAANLPDARNTVYWNPNLTFDSTGKVSVNFASPDTPGRYMIVLSVVDPDGNVIQRFSGIEIF
jgi:hypothetical protein